MVEIIGVPFDLCGRRLGSRLGPEAVRLAGLAEALDDIDICSSDSGDLQVPKKATEGEGLYAFEEVFECVRDLKQAVIQSQAKGNCPLVLGGDHSIGMAGPAATLSAHPDHVAVLWIDAHADYNTPGSSPSGNLHGMPLSALMGVPSGTTGPKDKQWQQLLELLGPNHLQKGRMAWFGLRDVDYAEREHIKTSPGSLAISMQDIDRNGINAQIQRFDLWMRSTGAKKLWISFDVDVLDPVLAPGTGTAVRGGLSYREAHLSAELICELLAQDSCPYELAGVDLVETNPLYDQHNDTATMAVEWLASLFGKTILGKR